MVTEDCRYLKLAARCRTDHRGSFHIQDLVHKLQVGGCMPRVGRKDALRLSPTGGSCWLCLLHQAMPCSRGWPSKRPRPGGADMMQHRLMPAALLQL